MILLSLLYEFFKTGLFAVGGGLATLPFVYRMADDHGWLTHPLIADMLAVAESAPGPIGVNLATYVGFHLAGLPGAVVAVLGLTAPSIVVIILVARAMKRFKENAVVAAVFRGLRPAAVGLLAAACFGVIRLSLYDREAATLSGMVRWIELGLFAALFALVWKFKKHPIVYVAGAAAAGIAFSL